VPRSIVKHFSVRYSLLTYRLDQLWFPLAFWMLFAIVAILRGPDYLLDTVRAYLGTVIPLVGGILAAYAILDDPALELRFSTPVRAGRLLSERLGLLLTIQAISALAFQAFALLQGTDFAPLGNSLEVQLAWFIPTLSLMALGSLCSLLGAQTMAGAFVAGIVWLVELVARGWFAQTSGKYILVFMGALMPDHPALRANQLSLFVLALVFITVAWLLLRRQERYI
jgi:hypothetical protein